MVERAELISGVDFSPGAYAPNGDLWWQIEYAPGTKRPFGGEQKLAAWLFWNVDEGMTFTMREMRDSIESSAEHLNRRLRKLREYGWVIPSYQDDRTLEVEQYRLVKKGWQPGDGPRPKTSGTVSQRVRGIVFKRDGSRCTVCGVGVGESYPNEPDSKAVMTIGHRIPQALGGGDNLDNLRTECSRCNEPQREDTGVPETFDEVYAQVRRLPKNDLQTLLGWLRGQQRGRSTLDTAYDRARALGHDERLRLIDELTKTLTGR